MCNNKTLVIGSSSLSNQFSVYLKAEKYNLKIFFKFDFWSSCETIRLNILSFFKQMSVKDILFSRLQKRRMFLNPTAYIFLLSEFAKNFVVYESILMVLLLLERRYSDGGTMIRKLESDDGIKDDREIKRNLRN